MKVIVASENPVKLDATRRGFERVFPDEEIENEGVKTASGVPDQPMSDEETRRGAYNRLRELQGRGQEADYFISIEGGVENVDDTIAAFAWIVISDTNGRTGESRATSFKHPPAIAKGVWQGSEAGHVGDELFGDDNIKQKGGILGKLTGGVITRADQYVDAVVLALIPIINPSLYGRE